jgi:predicted XRE-type DNA-binding protein
MKGTEMELVHGSGNVFRDFGHASPDVAQFKALLASEILKMLDREGLTVRGAHARTGVAAADFSRIRNADLGRFTLDRLVSIINRLGARVDVRVTVRLWEIDYGNSPRIPTDAGIHFQGLNCGPGSKEY